MLISGPNVNGLPHVIHVLVFRMYTSACRDPCMTHNSCFLQRAGNQRWG
jgi:hypothetical protein